MDGSIELGDATLRYESVGSGRTVLFIHAGVADSRMWDNQFDGLDGVRLVRYDMRRFGRSTLGSKPFTRRDDALGVLDHLRVDSAVLVGWSIGGNTALEIYDIAPERVDAMVLIGADAPGYDPGIDYQSPGWPEAVEAFRVGDMQRAAELEAEIWLAGTGKATSELDPEMVELFVDMDLIALRNETRRDELDSATPLTRLPDIGVPARVVVGERDIPQMIAAAEHLAGRLGNGNAIVIPDAAHLPSMTHPEQFNSVVIEYLNTL